MRADPSPPRAAPTAGATGNSKVDAGELDSYVKKLCRDPDSAGETIAADLLGGGEGALLAWVAAAQSCQGSSKLLFDSFVEHINPDGNQDESGTIKCAAAALGRPHAWWRMRHAACRCVWACCPTPAALHACRRRCVPTPAAAAPRCDAACMPTARAARRHAQAWQIAADRLGRAACATVVAIDESTGKVRQTTVNTV